jgi:hypothetical protein
MSYAAQAKIMELGIAIRIIYEDRDMFELRVRASNGEFTAQAEMYVDSNSCRELARVLRGFPTDKTDIRELGTSPFESCWLNLIVLSTS